jgi:hypothetical protein
MLATRNTGTFGRLFFLAFLSNDKMANDIMSNDKMLNDKMLNDKMLNDKMSNDKMSFDKNVEWQYVYKILTLSTF